MSNPRTVVSLLRRIIAADPGIDSVLYEKEKQRVSARFRSGAAWAEMLDEIELPVLLRDTITVSVRGLETERRFLAAWDCSGLKNEPEPVKGFQFDGRDAARRSRRAVTAQEEDGAALIGGQRHVGSGALSDLKSDASSSLWQQEAKQTKAKSIRVTLEWLEKISREARNQDKMPMLFIRFTDVPEHMVVEDDWVVIPASAFVREMLPMWIFKEVER